MFANKSKQKIKKIIVFKYTFQLILIHFVLGTILSTICLIIVVILSGWRDDLSIQIFFLIFLV